MTTEKTVQIGQDLPFSFAKHYEVLVQSLADDYAHLLHTPGLTSHAVLECQRRLGKPLKLVEVSKEAFAKALSNHYQQRNQSAEQMAEDLSDEIDLSQLIQEMPKTEDLLDSEDDAPIIKLLNALLSQAIKQDASDIHIETFENTLLVRFRIDGVLREVLQPQRVLAPLIVSRIKVMAKLDIAEKRLPQDGRITLRIAGHPIDIRVSTMPASHGERVVLRLLDKQAGQLNLVDLGMGPSALQLLQELIYTPHGIILVTGPTGSGKTTTLYAALTQLNDVSRNILTVEDPIEYDLPGIGQTQVNSKVKMTFAKGLRAMLRQDPDVVMVGEIRDVETAQIAVQASLTGHLVLSTLHTNSAIGAIARLRDMGVESFLLSSSLLGVIAQRLVRVLCPDCKEAKPADASECEALHITAEENQMLYHPRGCESCFHTGYKGRTGIYEIIRIDDHLQKLIHENASESVIKAYTRDLFPSIQADGFRRVLAGDTSLEEVIRVTTM